MSYTPTNWQTGDVVTAEKLNKIEQGVEGASLLPPISASRVGEIPIYGDDSILTLGGTEGTLVCREYTDENNNTFWAISILTLLGDMFVTTLEFDGSDFSIDSTKYELGSAWNVGKPIFADFNGEYVPLNACYVHSFLGPTVDFQSPILPLDSLGMTGYVGILYFMASSESNDYTVMLFKWQLD